MKCNYLIASVLVASVSFTGLAQAQTQQSREVEGVTEASTAAKAAIEAGKAGKMDEMKAKAEEAYKIVKESNNKRNSVQMERTLPHLSKAKTAADKGDKDGATTELEAAIKEVEFVGGY
jgi:predicted negative regulator of RcsB-dependent stress response